MAHQILQLADAHDIVTEDQDLELVLNYAEEIRSISLLKTCSSKSLQSLIASTHTCLHSKKSSGKLNGLVILQLLLEDSADEVFDQYGSNWIKIVWSILQKCQIDEGGLRLICEIVKTLVKRAPKFPDISKQLTTLVSPMIEALLDISRSKYPGLVTDCVSTVVVFFQKYPGSCGSSIGHVKSLLLTNITSESTALNTKILAKCMSLMPRLGGGGKEGIHHKANYVTLFQKLTYTLEDLINNIFSIGVHQSVSGQKQRPEEPLELPQIGQNADILKRAVHWQKQFEIVGECVSALIRVPFPHYKSIRLGLIISVIKNVFEQPLSEFAKMQGNESKILLFVLPLMQISALKILDTLLHKCKGSMLLFVPDTLDIIQSLLSDLRSFTDAFSGLKTQIYQVLCNICDTFGSLTSLEKAHKDLVSYLLSDILPQKEVPTVPQSKQAKKKANYVPIAKKEAKLGNVNLSVAALEAIASLVNAIGIIMDESIHKQIQCALIGMGMEQECAKTRLPKVAREKLYESIISLLSHGHVKTPSSLQLISHLFKISSQNDKELRSTCNFGLSLCMQQIHPSRASMHLDLPLEVKTINEIKDDLMKVHVFYVESNKRSFGTSLPTLPTVPKSNPTQDSGAENGVVENNTTEESAVMKEISSEQEKLRCSKEALKELGESLKRGFGASPVEIEDETEIPTEEESERITKEAYYMDENPIFIPDNLKPKLNDVKDDEPQAKQAKIDHFDTEAMLKDFVPILK